MYTLNENHIRRLELVKALFNRAVNQSHEIPPLCYSSILAFHDAVEWAMQTAGSLHGVGNKEIRFMEWWQLIQDKLPSDVSLEHKEEMRVLSSVRGDFKHQGILPSEQTLAEFRSHCKSFFNDNYPILFGIRYEDISMANLVGNPRVKVSLIEASNQWKANEPVSAITAVSVAFATLLWDYEEDIHCRLGLKPHHFVDDMSFDTSFYMFDENDPIANALGLTLGGFIDKTGKALANIQCAIRVISLGLNYRKYVMFMRLVPNTQMLRDGKPSTIIARDYEVVTESIFRFCFEFVIESAFTLQSGSFISLADEYIRADESKS